MDKELESCMLMSEPVATLEESLEMYLKNLERYYSIALKHAESKSCSNEKLVLQRRQKLEKCFFEFDSNLSSSVNSPFVASYVEALKNIKVTLIEMFKRIEALSTNYVSELRVIIINLDRIFNVSCKNLGNLYEAAISERKEGYVLFVHFVYI